MWNKKGTALVLLLWLISLCSLSSTKSGAEYSLASLLEIPEISWEYQRISGVAAISDGGDIILWIRQLAAERGFQITGLQEKDGYIAVDLLLSPEADGLSVKASVERLLEDKGGEGTLYLELVGTAKGRLSPEDCQQLVETIYRSQDGLIHSGQNGDGIFSVHGYAKSIGAYMMINGRPVNLSLAAAYDEILMGTRFYLGMPLVRENY